MTQKAILHIVDSSSRVRAELARTGFSLGHHCEVYSDVSELTEHLPDEGIILLRDDGRSGGIATLVETLVAAEIWLPLLATDVEPETGRVVAAVKAGALDYLALPVDRQKLQRVLSRITEEARALMQARRRMIEARNRISRLSRREREVLEWLSRGSSNKAIARQLDISPRTVEIHRANMMSKLGAHHPADAVRLQMEAELDYDSGEAVQG